MARFDFVFMLTRDDRTVPDAAGHVATALAAGVRHIGFKDVGLPFAALAEIHALIRTGGATSYLEVVSLDRASEAEIQALSFTVRWGPRYDPEMILEHAICHYLRHRRQLERW